MIAFVLGGYAVLMVLAQLRLSLVYSRLSFSPGFWAFTFSTRPSSPTPWPGWR